MTELDIVQAVGPLGVLALGALYILSNRRKQKNGEGYVTRAESELNHKEVMESLAQIQQNHLEHVTNHTIHHP